MGCKYCDGKRIDVSNQEGLDVFIRECGEICILSDFYALGEFNISYCPMCGRKIK